MLKVDIVPTKFVAVHIEQGNQPALGQARLLYCGRQVRVPVSLHKVRLDLSEMRLSIQPHGVRQTPDVASTQPLIATLSRQGIELAHALADLHHLRWLGQGETPQ